LQVLSGLLAFVPIALGLKALSKNRMFAGAFISFLLVGIATDITMGAIVNAGNILLATKVFQIYSLFEASIFLWCIFKLTVFVPIRKAVRYATVVIPLFWIFCMFFLPLLMKGFNQGSAIFDSCYEVIVAFLAGFAILNLTEENERIFELPEFWILFGVFFYCFGTFFIMIFLKTFLSQKIWFINNIINVISYGIYAVGFYKLSQIGLKADR
jgi:hypothetical protein